MDEYQYRGMCYQARGFEAVRATVDFGRANREFYQRHDEPRQLYLRELRPRARRRLRQARRPEESAVHGADATGPGPFCAPDLESLLERFGALPDARRGHGLRHRQQEIGALAQLAVDGKVLRGSGRHDGKPFQLLSAATHHWRLTLDQIPIEEESNEIPATRNLRASNRGPAILRLHRPPPVRRCALVILRPVP